MSKKLNVDKLNGYPYTDGGKLEVVGEEKQELDEKITYMAKFNNEYNNIPNLDIIIPDFITEIPEGGFRGKNNIKSIKLSSSLISIGDLAFRDCQSIKSIVIPKSVSSIGNNAFYRCTGLETVIFEPGTSLHNLGVSGSFESCNKLASIKIPDGISFLTYGTFNNCDRLNEIYVPRSINYFAGNRIFPTYNANGLDIYYQGTEEEWNSINGVSDLVLSEETVIHYNSYIPD